MAGSPSIPVDKDISDAKTLDDLSPDQLAVFLQANATIAPETEKWILTQGTRVDPLSTSYLPFDAPGALANAGGKRKLTIEIPGVRPHDIPDGKGSECDPHISPYLYTNSNSQFSTPTSPLFPLFPPVRDPPPAPQCLPSQPSSPPQPLHVQPEPPHQPQLTLAIYHQLQHIQQATLVQPQPTRSSPQPESIMNRLHVQNRLLQQELERKSTESEDATKALVLLAKAFVSNSSPNTSSALNATTHNQYVSQLHDATSVHNANLTLELYASEIQALRRENRELKGLIEGRRANVLPPGVHQAQIKVEPVCNDQKHGETAVAKGDASTPAWALEFIAAEKQRIDQENIHQSRVKIDEERNTYANYDADHSDIDSDSATPILPPKYSAGVANVGIQSLDDVISEDITFSPLSVEAKFTELDHDSDTASLPNEDQKFSYNPLPADLCKDEHEKALQRLRNIPAPTILKTGFESKDSFVGKNYDDLQSSNLDFDGAKRSNFAYGYLPHNSFSSAGRAHAACIKIESQGGLEIWNSLEDRSDAIQAQLRFAGRDDRNCTEVFKHGITFIPGKEDKNYHRTVVISNLPSDVQLRDVLAKVRGGEIMSAVLTDTISITGGMSVIVQFVQEAAAQEYVTFVNAMDNCLSFDWDGETKAAEVTLLNTPTYPVYLSHLKAATDNKHTRCISIHNVPSGLSITTLEGDLSCRNAHRASNLVEMYFDKHRTLYLEFASINIAGSAFGILTRWQEYQALAVRFEPDPCAGSLEKLILDAEPRKPLFPKGGFVDCEIQVNMAQLPEQIDELHKPIIMKNTVEKCKKALRPIAKFSTSTTNSDDADFSKLFTQQNTPYSAVPSIACTCSSGSMDALPALPKFTTNPIDGKITVETKSEDMDLESVVASAVHAAYHTKSIGSAPVTSSAEIDSIETTPQQKIDSFLSSNTKKMQVEGKVFRKTPVGLYGSVHATAQVEATEVCNPDEIELSIDSSSNEGMEV